MSQSKHTPESFSELRVEDGVNERVEAGVDVAEEGGRLEREVAGARVQVVPVDKWCSRYVDI